MEISGLAVKLEEGGIYAIEHDIEMSDECYLKFRKRIEGLLKEMDVKFILLPKGIRVAQYAISDKEL